MVESNKKTGAAVYEVRGDEAKKPHSNSNKAVHTKVHKKTGFM